MVDLMVAWDGRSPCNIGWWISWSLGMEGVMIAWYREIKISYGQLDLAQVEFISW